MVIRRWADDAASQDGRNSELCGGGEVYARMEDMAVDADGLRSRDIVRRLLLLSEYGRSRDGFAILRSIR